MGRGFLESDQLRGLLVWTSVIAILAVNALLPNTSAANERIVVAAFEYPPIYQNGPDKGLSGDIVVAAFKAVDIDVDLRFFPVQRMVQTVSDGQAVCGIGGAVLFSSPEVAPKVTVSSVVQYVTQTFMYDARRYPAGIAYTDIGDMNGYGIGVLRGSGIMRFLEVTPSLHLIPNNVHEGSAKQLAMGRIDVWAIVDLTGMMFMRNIYPDEAANFRFTQPFNRGDVSVVFSKAMDPDNQYNDRFRRGLAAIKANGTYMQLMAKYYGSEAAINRDSLADDMR